MAGCALGDMAPGDGRMPSAVATGEVHAHIPEDLYSSWSPSLSPDANRVAFISDRGGYPQIWLRALPGGPLSCVPLDGRRGTEVSWSPTAEWLGRLVSPPLPSPPHAWVAPPSPPPPPHC